MTVPPDPLAIDVLLRLRLRFQCPESMGIGVFDWGVAQRLRQEVVRRLGRPIEGIGLEIDIVVHRDIDRVHVRTSLFDLLLPTRFPLPDIHWILGIPHAEEWRAPIQRELQRHRVLKILHPHGRAIGTEWPDACHHELLAPLPPESDRFQATAGSAEYVPGPCAPRKHPPDRLEFCAHARRGWYCRSVAGYR